MSQRFSPCCCTTTFGCYIGPPAYLLPAQYITVPEEEPPPLCTIIDIQPYYVIPQTAVIVREDNFVTTDDDPPDHLQERVGDWKRTAGATGGLTADPLDEEDPGYRVITYKNQVVTDKGIKPRSLLAKFVINESGGQIGFCVRWGGSAETSDFILFQAGPAKMLFVENGTVIKEVNGLGPGVGVEFQVELWRVKRNNCDTILGTGEEDPLNHHWVIRWGEADNDENIKPNTFVTWDYDDANYTPPDFAPRDCVINYLDWDGWGFDTEPNPVENWGFVIGENTVDAAVRSAYLLSQPRVPRTDWRNPDAEKPPEERDGTLWYPGEEDMLHLGFGGTWKTTSSNAVLISTAESPDGTIKVQGNIRFCGFGDEVAILGRGNSEDDFGTELVIKLVDSKHINASLVGCEGEGSHELELETYCPSHEMTLPVVVGFCFSIAKVRDNPVAEDHDLVRGYITPPIGMGNLAASNQCLDDIQRCEIIAEGYESPFCFNGSPNFGFSAYKGAGFVYSRESVGYITEERKRWGIKTNTISHELVFTSISGFIVDTTLIEHCYPINSETIVCVPMERCPQCHPAQCGCCYDGTIPQFVYVKIGPNPPTQELLLRRSLEILGGTTPENYFPVPENCYDCGGYETIVEYCGTLSWPERGDYCVWKSAEYRDFKRCFFSSLLGDWDVQNIPSYTVNTLTMYPFGLPGPSTSSGSTCQSPTFTSHTHPAWTINPPIMCPEDTFTLLDGITISGHCKDGIVTHAIPSHIPVPVDCRWSMTRTKEDLNKECCFEIVNSAIAGSSSCERSNRTRLCLGINYLGAWLDTGPDTHPPIPDPDQWEDPAYWEYTQELEIVPLDSGGVAYDPSKELNKWIVEIKVCNDDGWYSINNETFQWELTNAGESTAEYALYGKSDEGVFDLGLSEPIGVRLEGYGELTKGTNGMLSEGQWTWYYNIDSVDAFLTIIVRLPGDVDPDSLDPNTLEAYWGPPGTFLIACTKPPAQGVEAIQLTVPGIGIVCFEIVNIYPSAMCKDNLACALPIFIDCPEFVECSCEGEE